ncbi:hypothetical protein RBSWK_00239 [Rhodopirellula baltica SWK14]|uniref:Uncharacterized protein n=1 Tax=Rhodopirellula baltica SWK14 TaxID=993516 RepID=L7CQ98_RHOBT|nr:hypothetical protein RBSWK_00239 [Rhodopirellula baltica SWK14]
MTEVSGFLATVDDPFLVGIETRSADKATRNCLSFQKGT